MWRRMLVLGTLPLVMANRVPAQNPNLPFTIGKETTSIIEPLRADGRVDYVEALSRMQQKGVTAENNSAVLFRRALGLRGLKPEFVSEYFRLLGTEMLPSEGNYLTTLDEFIRLVGEKPLVDDKEPSEIRQAFYHQASEARSRPWTREEFSVIAQWIDANEMPLKFAIEGSSRTKYSEPLLPKDKSLIVTGNQSTGGIREIAMLLNTRAMLKLGEGHADSAWQDTIASHQIARLVVQAQTTIWILVGAAIEEMSCRRVHKIASNGKLTFETCSVYMNELRNLGPWCDVSGFSYTADRYQTLDKICEISGWDAEKFARNSKLLILTVRQENAEKLSEFLKQSVEHQRIEWDDVLRRANKWYDQFDAAAKLQSRGTREEELLRLESEHTRKAKKARRAVRNATVEERETVTRLVGDLLLSELVISHQVIVAMDRCEMNRQLAYCSLALAAWKSKHGSYPESIDLLVPEILNSIPLDLYSERPLIYRRTETGYLLYSVGPNLNDDGGLPSSDTTTTDDIAIQATDENQ